MIYKFDYFGWCDWTYPTFLVWIFGKINPLIKQNESIKNIYNDVNGLIIICSCMYCRVFIYFELFIQTKFIIKYTIGKRIIPTVINC